MRAEGAGERHVGLVPWKGEGRGKPDVTVKSWKVCREQTVKGACLECLFALGTRAVIALFFPVIQAAMACIQGGHPLVPMSSCFDS